MLTPTFRKALSAAQNIRYKYVQHLAAKRKCISLMLSIFINLQYYRSRKFACEDLNFNFFFSCLQPFHQLEGIKQVARDICVSSKPLGDFSECLIGKELKISIDDNCKH